MASNSINFKINFDTNTSGIVQAQKALEQLRNLSNKDIAIFNNTGLDETGLKKARSIMMDIQTESGKAQKAMAAAFNQKLGTVNMERFREELQKNGTSLEQFRNTMAKAGPIGEKAFTEMAAGLSNVKYQTVQTTTILDKMTASLQRSLTTFVSINIINKVKGSINEAYGYVKNLDTSLNQIRIVTGKSADEMDRFAEKANKAAASLGKATTDYTKASTTFYQQGLGDTEVQARTDVTLKAANTTGQDSKVVADNLTALWNGFNVGAEEAEIYVDRLAALAATTASNLDELTTAMSKTASMASVMGVSEEQLAAQIATVVSVTRQAPESVGTAFKSIYSRISDINAGAEDAETTLGNYSSKLAALGINVLDSSGKLRNMGEVIEEVGGKWKNYSKEQQVAIAGIMGGQRQVNQVTALFDNWDEYTESIETMANAEGTLQKQQDIYMESAQGQLQKLRTEWEGVLDSLLKAEDIIKVAKAISPIFTSLEKVIDAFGGGLGILTKFSPLLFGLVSPKIAEGIGKIGSSFTAAANNAEIAKSEIASFSSQLDFLESQAQDKEAFAGYSEQVRDLIKQYEALRDSMSIEQKNAFHESLEKIIEVEGPKALKVLNELRQSQTELLSDGFSAGKSASLGSLIDTQDINELEKYQKDIDDLITDLSKDPEQIKNNFDQIKDKIKNTFGENNEYANVFIKNLERQIREANVDTVGKMLADELTKPLNEINVDELKEKINSVFKQDPAAAEQYIKILDETITKKQKIADLGDIEEIRKKGNEQQQQELSALDRMINLRGAITGKQKEIEKNESAIQKTIEDSKKAQEEINEALKKQEEILSKAGAKDKRELSKDLKNLGDLQEYEKYNDIINANTYKIKQNEQAVQILSAANDKLRESQSKTQEKLKAYNKTEQEQKNLIEENSRATANSLNQYRATQGEIDTTITFLRGLGDNAENTNAIVGNTAQEAAEQMAKESQAAGKVANALQQQGIQSSQTAAKTLSLKQAFSELDYISIGQDLGNIAQGFLSIGTAIKSLIDLWQVWNDEDLTVIEKVTKTLTAVAAVGPIVAMSIGKMNTALSHLTKKETIDTIAVAANTLARKINKKAVEENERAVENHTGALRNDSGATAENTGQQALNTAGQVANNAAREAGQEAGAATGGIKGLTAGFKALGTALGPIAPTLLGIAGAVGLFIAAFAIWNKAMYDDPIKEMEKAKEKNKEAYDSLQNLKKGYEDYQKTRLEFEDKLKGMTRGTDEYNEALKEQNENIENLIEQYPKLKAAMKIGANGEKILDEEMSQQIILEESKKTMKKQRKAIRKGFIDNNYLNTSGLGGNWQGATNTRSAAFNRANMLEFARTMDEYKEIDDQTLTAITKRHQAFDREKTIADYFEKDVDKVKEEAKRLEEISKEIGFSYQGILNGDYSTVSKNEATAAMNYSDEEIANMLGINPNDYMVGTEEYEDVIAQIQDFRAQMALAYSQASDFPNAFKDEEWDDIDSGIKEKFRNVAGTIEDSILTELGSGLKELEDSGKDIDEFTDDLANIDWSKGNSGLVEFREKYGQLNEEIEAYIQAQIQANAIGEKVGQSFQRLADAMTAISQKKFGDMFSEKDYQEIIAKFDGLEKYFVKIGDKYQYIAKSNQKVIAEMRKAYGEELGRLDQVNKQAINTGINKNTQDAVTSYITEKDGDKDTSKYEKTIKEANDKIIEAGTEFISAISGETNIAIQDINDLLKKNVSDMTEEELVQLNQIYAATGKIADQTVDSAEMVELHKQYIVACVETEEELNRLIEENAISEEAASQTRIVVREKEIAAAKALLETEQKIFDLENKKQRSSVQTELADIEARLAKATGEEWAELYKKREELRQKDLELAEESAKKHREIFEEQEVDVAKEIVRSIDFSKAASPQVATQVAEQVALAIARGEDLEEQAQILKNFFHMSDEGINTLLGEGYERQQQLQGIEEEEKAITDAQKEQILTSQEIYDLTEGREKELRKQRLQRDNGKLENQLAHATGKEYVRIYQQIKKNEEEYKNILQEELDLANEDVDAKKKILEETYYIKVGEDGIVQLQEGRKNYSKEALAAIEDYNKSKDEQIKKENEVLDLEKEQFQTLTKIDDLRRKGDLLSRETQSAQKDAQYMNTKDWLGAQSGITQRQAAERANKQELKTEYSNKRATDLAALEDIIGQGVIKLDKYGGIANMSDVEKYAIDDEQNADRIRNLMNSVNECADSVWDLDESLKTYKISIDEMNDEQAKITSNDITLSKLQEEAQGLTGKALLDNLSQQKKIQNENKSLYEGIANYNKELQASLAEGFYNEFKIDLEIDDNGIITNLENVYKAIGELTDEQKTRFDEYISKVEESGESMRGARDAAESIDKKIPADLKTQEETDIETYDRLIKESEARQANMVEGSAEWYEEESKQDEYKRKRTEEYETIADQKEAAWEKATGGDPRTALRKMITESYGELLNDANSRLAKLDPNSEGYEEAKKAIEDEITGYTQDMAEDLAEIGKLAYDEASRTFTGEEGLNIHETTKTAVDEINKKGSESVQARSEATVQAAEDEGKKTDETKARIEQIQKDREAIDKEISELEKEKATAEPEKALEIQAKINEKYAERRKLLQEELDLQEKERKVIIGKLDDEKQFGFLDKKGLSGKELVKEYTNKDGVFDAAAFKEAINFDSLSEGQQGIVDNWIKSLEDANGKIRDINENLKIVKLPYNAYEKFEMETKRIEKAEKDLEQQQDALNNKFEESERRISDLQGEAEFLTGDDLVANLEQQADELQKQIEYKKEQAELDKKAIELAERKKKNAEEEAEYAKKALETLKDSVSEKIKETDVDGSMVKGATDQQKAQAQVFFDNFDIEKYIDKETGILSTNKLRAELLELGLTAETVDKYLEDYNSALDKYDSATDAATAATKAYDEANQKYANTLQEVTEKERERIKAEREAAQQKLQTGEDAINRETTAQHKLEKALRDVDKAIQQVQKDQNDLSGQQLISKIQEEIQLQQKKKQVLEQQLKQIKEQIQALIDLYALHMSTEYGINVGFNVDETGVTNIDELYAAIEGLDAEMKGAATEDLERMISAIQSLTSNAASAMDSIDGMTDTIDDLNKKLKEQQEADLFRIKDEKWNYEEQQLKRIDKALQNIQKDQSKLSGNALIANLTAQQKMLDKQVETYQRKLELMKAELSAMQSMLAMQGVIFDSNGLISNYAQAYANMDDKTRSYMQSYQSLYDQIMDLESTIQDTYDKKADLEIQKTQERLKMFNAKVDVELNMEKAKREWQKFKKEFLNTLNGFEELNDSILEKTKQNMKDIYSMTTKDVTLLTDHVSRIIDEIHLMQGGGTSSLYGTDQSTAISDLANYRQQIQESLSSIADKMREVNEAYLQQLDKIQGKFDEQLSNYELIQNIISHDMNIIKILRGDNAYEELSRYYDKATANYEQEIAFLRKQVDYWRKLMEQEPVGTKKWEYFQQHWKDALSKLNSAVDAALENIVAKYDTKLQAIFQKIKKNSKLDWKLEKWDLDKQLSEMFTDQITTEYSLQKLQDQYIKAAQDTDDPTKKQKILDIMRDQIKAYRELSKESIRKGRLTEREIELANKQYELEMARLELQDQEKNKTKMRLRRDSSGDYRYEFVADEEKIEDIRQKILDLEEEIRLFAEETRKQVIDTYTGAVQTALDGMQQAYQDWRDGIITDEELQERLAYYKDWLTQMGAATSTQYDAAITALVQATADEMRDLGIAADEDIERLKQHVIATMEELYPTFGDLFYSLDEQIAEIEGLVGQATTELLDLMAEMKAEFAAIGDAAGICFDSIIDGTDGTIDQMYQLIDDNYELLDQYELELNQIEALIDELSRLQDAYRDVYDAAMEAVDAALELKETAQSIPDYSSTFNQQINIGTGGGSSAPSSSTAGKSTTPSWLSKSYKSKSNTMKKEEEKPVTEVKSDSPSIGEIRADKAKDLFKRGTSFIYSIITQTYKEEYVSSGAGQLDDGELIGLSTGGYTGDWGSNGKVALLHEKELVLNKDDTKNILDAVQILRQNNNPNNYNDNLMNNLSNLIDATYDFYAQMLDMATEQLNALTSATQMINQVTTNNTTNNINANFPNATQYNEIEKALQNLGNATSQRLGLNKRR